MECNKDEAIKAKEIAEKKFTEMDISGAKRFALKAQDLYPGLDGLSQFLATLDVYIFAEKRISGEVDWYKVLGVEPLADDDTIRRHYRKLALILHPDKNKSVGADGAFKLLSQAWSLLSDKSKRIAYDQNRNLRRCEERKPSAPTQNGFHNLFNTNNSTNKDQRSTTHPMHAPTPSVPLKPTFWTVCNACKVQFEYHTVYLNCNLICSSCQKRFLALEVPPPPINKTAANSRIYQMQRQKFSPSRMDRQRPSSAVNSSENNFHSAAFSMSGNTVSGPFAAQAAGVARAASAHLKRGHEEVAPPAMREEAHFGKTQASQKTVAGLAAECSDAGSSFVVKGDLPRKKMRTHECGMANDRRAMEKEMAAGKGGVCAGSKCESQKDNSDTGRMNAAGNYKRNGTRDLSQAQIRNLLMVKARKEILRRLNDTNIDSKSRNLHKSNINNKEVKENDQGRNKASGNAVKVSAENFQDVVDSKTSFPFKELSPANSDADSAAEVTDPVSMKVPDPDFHDFDEDRTEKSFGANQVWAAYDDDDGMPRYYAMIHSVISLKPFKVRIGWFNAKSNNELAPLNWIGSGFPKTTGDFRIGKYEVNDSLNSFSHRVKWTKGMRGSIQIYPKKGDVWALYRNWSPNWNVLTPDEVIHKYDMVEVLEDYSEERGVNVVPLVKVAGFKTVFRQNSDQSKIRNVPRAEMFCFSHQVPSYLLTGQEGTNAPEGCWELDPASTPMELLQIVIEAHKEELIVTAEAAITDRLGCGKKPQEDNLDGDCQTIKEEDLVEDNPRRVLEEATVTESREVKLAVYKRKRLREKKML
ncbi:DnAJ-like protein [Quillaja saponaria]|uniref:DnAJ-like protein n=1 Tax=Quillaja saponaria TaxID=32244 RepID=A0AAD7KTT9_QUISA|nr:DnAJ-like protein [Quillaja saponaria]KAJ7945695.1 DnAJ-like protein [Quillaja saponaria]